MITSLLRMDHASVQLSGILQFQARLAFQATFPSMEGFFEMRFAFVPSWFALIE
ncbi:hypothetical protein HNQ59_001738 [Chitinivorax tropicus]|uniref:Uncharacterized protein n=1 Tax=Chitinivorax tropicus TaxID=714531 RepID=A0A840MMW0_9PROT|nr:hypothetical protein [Chitinivorax tropicus]MBB5018449.1 hypothetical protein [Chitinivorax tropicus]